MTVAIGDIYARMHNQANELRQFLKGGDDIDQK